MRNLILALAVLSFGVQSLACKRTPESAARAEETAVREYLKKDPKWSGYKIQSLKRRDGIYTLSLKQNSKREKLQLEATTEPNCKVSVNLPTGP